MKEKYTVISHLQTGIVISLFISLSVLSYDLSAQKAPALIVEKVSDRSTFIRMEKDVTLRFRVTNQSIDPLQEIVLSVAFTGAELKPEVNYKDSARVVKINTLASGKSSEIPVGINTQVRPGDYKILIEYYMGGDDSLIFAGEFPVKIVPRKLPDEFPVVMWGNGVGLIKELKKIGFTHALGINPDLDKIWQAGKPVSPMVETEIQKTRLILDDALAEGITFVSSLGLSRRKGLSGFGMGLDQESNAKYWRITRDGKPYPGEISVCGLFPEIKKFYFNIGVSMAEAFSDMPAWGAALLNTEARDNTLPCFHKHDQDAFRKVSGLDIPMEIKNKSVDYKKVNNFPQNRIISDNDPLYLYYRWYWKEGDGWNGLNNELIDGLKTMNRPEFWTWHDPAVRVASTYGSGGSVDVISHWTYTYPDPIKIGLAADELIAMADGAGQKQDVMSMTQIIWKRSQVTQSMEKGGKKSDFAASWERELPKAEYITIAPMHLREAFWTEIARPIKGIMYHGWQSLVKNDGKSAYQYTNSSTQHELERLINNVVKPLGPTLKTVPPIKSDIAFYESFASQVYSNWSIWGGGWLSDAYFVLLWAGLQPEIVYDETINKKGLDSYKLLVMVDCDVLTRSVLEKVKAFQKKGGIVIGDKNLAPDVKPNILIDTYDRTSNALNDKKQLLSRAGKLREDLDILHYSRYLDSSNPEVVSYRRRFGETDYIFLVNDNREYGQYLGQHEMLMENGLPSNTQVSVRRNTGFAYNLVDHQPLHLIKEKDRMVVDISLGPCDGQIIMVTPVEIDHIKIISSDKAARGKQQNISIVVSDIQGKAVEAIIPVEVQIKDSEGRVVEFSGYRAAVNGEVSIVINIAPNDCTGTWEISARELASGKSVTAYFRVEK